MHDLFTRRGELGEYHRLVQELRHDPERFRRYFRMSMSQFDMLLDLIGPETEKLSTNWRRSISTAERLAIALGRSVCNTRTLQRNRFTTGRFYYAQRGLG